MKTQLSVRVKKESFYSKMMGKFYLGPLSMFGKRPIIVSIDGKEQKLLPSKKPYLLDIEPGSHQVDFIDPQRKAKHAGQAVNKAWDAAMGAAVGAAVGGGAMGAYMGATGAAQISETSFNMLNDGGSVQVNIKEGDILKLKCRAQRNGSVKVELDS